MTSLRFVGNLHFMGQQWPVDFTINIPDDQPTPPGDGIYRANIDPITEPFELNPADRGLPIEIRPHAGRKITVQAVAAAAADQDKDALLAARFPWLADCFTVSPAKPDPVAADIQRLANVPEQVLLKPDGTINKSAVARELGYTAGGGKWAHINEIATRLRSRLRGAA